MSIYSDQIAVVTAGHDFHPLRKRGLIERLLSKDCYEGEVLFDLLYFNGLSPNRFVSCKFTDGRLDIGSSVIVTEVAEHILEGQNKKAREDHIFLEGSVLSEVEIEELHNS